MEEGVIRGCENSQSAGGRRLRKLIPPPPNPVLLAGQQLQFRPMSVYMQPKHRDRDTRVEVVRA